MPVHKITPLALSSRLTLPDLGLYQDLLIIVVCDDEAIHLSEGILFLEESICRVASCSPAFCYLAYTALDSLEEEKRSLHGAWRWAFMAE